MPARRSARRRQDHDAVAAQRGGGELTDVRDRELVEALGARGSRRSSGRRVRRFVTTRIGPPGPAPAGGRGGAGRPRDGGGRSRTQREQFAMRRRVMSSPPGSQQPDRVRLVRRSAAVAGGCHRDHAQATAAQQPAPRAARSGAARRAGSLPPATASAVLRAMVRPARRSRRSTRHAAPPAGQVTRSRTSPGARPHAARAHRAPAARTWSAAGAALRPQRRPAGRRRAPPGDRRRAAAVPALQVAAVVGGAAAHGDLAARGGVHV